MASAYRMHRLNGTATKDESVSRARVTRTGESKGRRDGGGEKDKLDSAAAASTDSAEKEQMTAEERKALLRRQISETMARVRKLTEEERKRDTLAEQDGESGRPIAWKERRRERLTTRSSDSPARSPAPQFDPESPFEDRSSPSYRSNTASRLSPVERRTEGKRGSMRSRRDAQAYKNNTSERPPRRQNDAAVVFSSSSEEKKSNIEEATPASAPSTSKEHGRQERTVLHKSPNGARRRITVSNDAGVEKKSHFVSTRRSVDLNGHEKGKEPRTNSSLNAAMQSGQSESRRRVRDSITGQSALEIGSQYRTSASPAAEWGKQDEEATEYSPRPLSKETSRALASLEATLSRLQAYSPAPEQMKVDKENEQSNGARSRRSLSPSKEMRERENLRERVKREPDQNVGSVEQLVKPKMSFLARVEQTKAARSRPTMKAAEVVTLSKGVQVEQKDESASPRSEASVQTQPVSRRRSLYTYSPPKKVDKEMQCTVELDESGSKNTSCGSSSMVFGDESVDEIIAGRAAEMKREFLQGTTILVDVRDQDGEDASETWIAKLREAGAKVYAKPPQTSRRRRSGATNEKDENSNHVAPSVDYIIFKHGRPATTHYYRAQVDAGRAPPIIVGVNWILHSLREGRKVDERDFVVEIGRQALFAPRRRNSMTAKKAPNDALSTSSTVATTAEGDEELDRDNLSVRRKLMQNAPVRPSPLANRCWNLDASTSSIATTTAHNTTIMTTYSHATDDVAR